MGERANVARLSDSASKRTANMTIYRSDLTIRTFYYNNQFQND